MPSVRVRFPIGPLTTREPDGQAVVCKTILSGFDSHLRLFVLPRTLLALLVYRFAFAARPANAKRQAGERETTSKNLGPTARRDYITLGRRRSGFDSRLAARQVV